MKTKQFQSLSGAILTIALCPLLVVSQNKLAKPDKPNVLFIAVDDLRPELGCYGKNHIKSPNIDRLANSGIIFKNAYCSYPSCGPSRASLLSGLYPNYNRFVGWNCWQDKDVPGVVSLPMHFRNNDYTTISLGKIYNVGNFDDGRGSWDKRWVPPRTTTEWGDYQSAEGIRSYEENRKKGLSRGAPYESPDVPDITYMDGRIAQKAIEELQAFKNSSEPFFLAVGFLKPHLPFNAPKKYWDMYDEEDIEMPSNNYFPKDVPKAADYGWRFDAHGIPRPLTETTFRNLMHGYYACVSYVDAQIGLVLNALESLELADNTIVVFWGDHGYLLGEHDFWGKHCSYELGPHAPLIVKVPWEKSAKKTEALIEFIDIYPSLCEIAGLPKPFHLQGKSFVPLMTDPDQPWKEAVFYKTGHSPKQAGETILTKTHAYTEWYDSHKGEPYARMLFDHRVDPEENVNVAELHENKDIVKTLREKLHAHMKERDIITIP